ncbi:hypothetical protein [Pseudoxanthomonas kalamensis]|nr:hypothetical protein [Pseudoxanthomonas kalamensis]
MEYFLLILVLAVFFGQKSAIDKLKARMDALEGKASKDNPGQ